MNDRMTEIERKLEQNLLALAKAEKYQMLSSKVKKPLLDILDDELNSIREIKENSVCQAAANAGDYAIQDAQNWAVLMFLRKFRDRVCNAADTHATLMRIQEELIRQIEGLQKKPGDPLS